MENLIKKIHSNDEKYVAFSTEYALFKRVYDEIRHDAANDKESFEPFKMLLQTTELTIVHVLVRIKQLRNGEKKIKNDVIIGTFISINGYITSRFIKVENLIKKYL